MLLVYFCKKQSVELHPKVSQYSKYLFVWTQENGWKHKPINEKKLQKIGWQMGDNDSDRSEVTIWLIL